MNKRRLLTLAKYLPGVPRKRFCSIEWANELFTRKNERSYENGTSACSIGWATTIPSFARAGFHLKVNDTWPWAPSPYFPPHEPGIMSVAAFFELCEGDALYIFGEYDVDRVPRVLEGPKQAAKRILAFVKTNGKIPSSKAVCA